MERGSVSALRSVLLPLEPDPPPGDGLVPAGVLVLLGVPGRGEPLLLLQRRSDQVAHHPGEVSFPGGAQDPGDPNLLATALRETEEEMGVAPGDAEVLGALGVQVTRTGFLVRPFVAWIPYPYPLRPNAEVAEVVPIPLSALWDPGGLRVEMYQGPDRLERRYAFVYNRRVVFGATARILMDLVERISPLWGRRVPWPTGRAGCEGSNGNWPASP